MATTRKRITLSDLAPGDTVGLDVEGYEYCGEYRGTVYAEKRERAVIIVADGTRYDIPTTLIGRVRILRHESERLVTEEDDWPLLREQIDHADAVEVGSRIADAEDSAFRWRVATALVALVLGWLFWRVMR